MGSRPLVLIFVISSFVSLGGVFVYFKNQTNVSEPMTPSKDDPNKIILHEPHDQIIPDRLPSSLSVKESRSSGIGSSDNLLALENRSAPSDESSRSHLQNNHDTQGYFWALSPLISWKQLNSRYENQNIASNIRAITDTNLGLSFTYGMNVNDSLRIFTNLESEAVSFLDDNNSLELKNKKLLMNRVAVGANLKSNWFFEVAMKDMLFLVSPTQTTINIEKVTLPEIKTKYKADLYKFREASLSYAVSGNLFLPRRGETINSRQGFGAGIILEAKLRNHAFGMGYEKSYLEATENSTSTDNIFWRFTWEAF